MRQFVIVGAGSFGASVAMTLSKQGFDVLVIDNDKAKIRQISPHVTTALEMDASDEQALRSLGIEGADVAIVSIGQEMESSILVTMVLKEMGVKTVVSKALTDAHGRVLRRVGADRVVFPEKQMGVRIANSLVSPSIVDIMELAPGYSLAEVKAPSWLWDKNIAQSAFRSQHGLTIVAIKRRTPSLDDRGESSIEEQLVMAPDPSEMIQKSDSLIVLGRIKDVEALQETMGRSG